MTARGPGTLATRVQPRDVILVSVGEQPAFFARVEEILADPKKGWLQMRFRVLSVPPRELTWILEPDQIDGTPFTMGGTPVRIERLPDPVPQAPPPEAAPPGPGGKVVSFPGRSRP